MTAAMISRWGGLYGPGDRPEVLSPTWKIGFPARLPAKQEGWKFLGNGGVRGESSGRCVMMILNKHTAFLVGEGALGRSASQCDGCGDLAADGAAAPPPGCSTWPVLHSR
ncbi:MAG: hypothetical protein ACLR8Y_02435 [Alistipes indistinctus]